MESSFVIYLIKNKKTDRTVKTDQWKADQQKQNSETRISEKYRKEKEMAGPSQMTAGPTFIRARHIQAGWKPARENIIWTFPMDI